MRAVVSSTVFTIFLVSAFFPASSVAVAKAAMSERTFADSIAVEVHTALTSYVDVHNDVFALNLRRVIPIPGIFESIDFATHIESLIEIQDKLVRVGTVIESANRTEMKNPSVNRFLVSLNTYRTSLLETVRKLVSISEKLHEKEQNSASYVWDTYQGDMDSYQKSREAYSELGVTLNKAYQEMRP